MNLCQSHWDRLREKIEAKDLMRFAAPDGKTATRMMVDQIERGQLHTKDTVTKQNFDPLMGAFFAIGNNGMQFISQAGVNPLYLMTEGPEDPVDIAVFPNAPEGATWPKCVVCYLNLAHKMTCQDPRCTLDIENGYDWMLDKAVEGSLEEAQRLGLIG